jgi:hypothetical protein
MTWLCTEDGALVGRKCLSYAQKMTLSLTLDVNELVMYRGWHTLWTLLSSWNNAHLITITELIVNRVDNLKHTLPNVQNAIFEILDHYFISRVTNGSIVYVYMPRYSWNIVKVGVKHQLIYQSIFVYRFGSCWMHSRSRGLLYA